MIDYQKDVRGKMARIGQLIGTTIRTALETQDLDGLEDRLESHFDLIRGIVKRVRADIAEEITA